MKHVCMVLSLLVFTFAMNRNIYGQAAQYIVPKTSKAPVIDGKMDELWEFAPRISDLLLILEKTQESIPTNWDDANPSFRLMWDDDNLYIYAETNDDTLHKDGLELHKEKSRGYNDDCFELFFDGDNSHSDWDGTNDCEIWFLYDEPDVQFYTAATAPIPLNNIVFEQQTWKNENNTKTGWSIEIAIPLNDLSIQPLAGYTFGMDVKYSDDDGRELNDASWSPGKDREHNMRWCQNYDNHPPSTWYYVELGGADIQPFIQQKTVDTIETDGQIEEEWNNLPWYSGNVYTNTQNLILYGDASFNFKVASDGHHTHLLVLVEDDEFIDNNRDQLAFYIDGDGISGNSFDANTFAFGLSYTDGGISAPYALSNSNADILSYIQTAASKSDTGLLIEVALQNTELQIGSNSWSMELSYFDYDNNDESPVVISFCDSTGTANVNPSVYSNVISDFVGSPALSNPFPTPSVWYSSHQQTITIHWDKRTATTTGYERQQFRAFDLQGKELVHQPIGSTNENVTIHQLLPTGIYYWQISAANTIYTGSLQVTRQK